MSQIPRRQVEADLDAVQSEGAKLKKNIGESDLSLDVALLFSSLSS